ncbi:uncharacterized protein T551_02137 [Pneumocystis jirovecii RU7]|uniref:Mediator of RNA polymerase II transcription subunit 19 n=1 Tax=Pneumocystis jirovecii (strain RU7) TaxID=1408657 RepID=A0A0W4ZMC8_PNEJ7|nr:uncharacterized protein T551_02137 [Pneumocystis jirovecii RU7]KTW29521.1 hypothetical protein T551_02137 [Pneumocystis jirovecii RU7]
MAEEFYFVNHSSYSQTIPSVTEDLQCLYGLNELAKRVARVDEFGNKRKMRQSYKGHIQHLPGENVILKDRFIRDLILKPQEDKTNKFIEDLDPEMLEMAFTLQPEPVSHLDSNILEYGSLEKDELYDNKDRESTRSINDTKRYSKKKRKHDEYELFSDSGQKKKYKKTS